MRMTQTELSEQTTAARFRQLRLLVALAPIVFAAHVAEEAPGFVEWFNSHVSPGISSRSFWQVNLAALVITVIVSAVGWFGGSTVVTVAWLSFLMGANALLHVAGAIVDRGYVPGLVTAIIAYVPYCAFVFWRVKRTGLGAGPLVVTAVVSAIPMLIHGYRILFLGTRLF